MEDKYAPVHAKDLRPPGDTDTDYVETCAVHLAKTVNESSLIVMLRPWSGRQEIRQNILAPRADVGGGVLERSALENAAAFKTVILIPCTFTDPDEEVGARYVIPELHELSSACVIALQLLPMGFVLDRSNIDFIMARHDAILETRVDYIKIDPNLEQEALRKSINLACMSWQCTLQRQELMLQEEPAQRSMAVLKKLEEQHRRLLWESIPRASMPHFPQVDAKLHETESEVGTYSLLSVIATRSSRRIVQAMDKMQQRCILKIFDKPHMTMPGQLESIYREFRLLSGMTDHPNIIKCHKMLHSSTRVYMVLDHAGQMNLLKVLSSSKGKRLDETTALHCFSQLAGALEYCHGLGIAHRQICLEHVIVQQQQRAGGHICRLVDFSAAITQKTSSTYCSAHGTLPCIAPEVALGSNYLPIKADRWSVAVVLLELAGGLSSMETAVGFTGTTPLKTAGDMCMRYFSQPHAHSTALACKSGVENLEITSILQALMRPVSSERANLSDVIRLR